MRELNLGPSAYGDIRVVGFHGMRGILRTGIVFGCGFLVFFRTSAGNSRNKWKSHGRLGSRIRKETNKKQQKKEKEKEIIQIDQNVSILWTSFRVKHLEIWETQEVHGIVN